ncbi:MAG TPA: tetratricopeptide repeat protein [Verrucomicrobiae bacterium]|nr:tetratricopeptide repeat protein [Verrucomicrobiae bacterium]
MLAAAMLVAAPISLLAEGAAANATNAVSAADSTKTNSTAAFLATAPTNDLTAEPAPALGAFPTPGTIVAVASNVVDHIKDFQTMLDLARDQRRAKDFTSAELTLVTILETNAPPELRRLALFEMALVAQDENQLVKAQQVFAQYVHTYPDDPSVPEVMLRQASLYRQMGVNTLAISKYYAVMSSALNLKLDNMDYYKKLVLQAQIEIADTYYLEGKYDEASDFFNRILKANAPDLNKIPIQFKLIRCLSYMTNNTETVARSQVFLDLHTNSTDIPEVRFILASALKKLGRNHEAMKQVLLLLQSQQENVKKNPETWIYWQQRAGNEIANQLYKEGDYFSALQIYLSLADLNQSPAWQLPVWYQAGLVYEQLQQWQKATETYTKILSRQKELTPEVSTPTLASLMEMSKWRKDYIDWMQKARMSSQAYQPAVPAMPADTGAPTATPPAPSAATNP